MESMRHSKVVVAMDWSKINSGSIHEMLIDKFNQISSRIEPRLNSHIMVNRRHRHHRHLLINDQHNSNKNSGNIYNNINNTATRNIEFNKFNQMKNNNWISDTMLGLFIMLTIATRATVSITLRRVDVPTMLKIGDNATLTCHYDLAHHEKLYALKWYRDGKEFYRFLPSEKIEERKQAFRMEGIHVDLLRSTDRMVTLNNVNLNSAGNFKCEALIEDTFKSVAMERKMNIIDQQRNRLHQQASNYHNQHHSSSSSKLVTIQSSTIILLTIIGASLNLIIDDYLAHIT